MAEAIGIASGLLTLAGFAFQSTKLLYETINSFRSSKRTIRELKYELGDLMVVLASLEEVVNNADPIFNSLKAPLFRCGKACEEFRY
jgi:hypothetical protein